MAIGEGGYDEDGTSWPADETSENLGQARRDMFDLTVCKIRILNSPARRDTSLRKSVLIFNLLRCLQRENICDWGYDVEMVANTSSTDAATSSSSDDSNDDDDDDAEGDSTMSDESMIYEDSTIDDDGPDSDHETESAVFALSAIDSDLPGNSDRPNQVHTQAACYHISSTDRRWNEQPEEMMDVDNSNYQANVDLASAANTAGEIDNNYVDHVQRAATNNDLITESFRLIENGGYAAMIDQSSSVEHVRSSYGTIYANGKVGGEHRSSFEHGRSFDLFA